MVNDFVLNALQDLMRPFCLAMHESMKCLYSTEDKSRTRGENRRVTGQVFTIDASKSERRNSRLQLKLSAPGQEPRTPRWGKKIGFVVRRNTWRKGVREFAPVEGHVILLTNGINAVVREESVQLKRN